MGLATINSQYTGLNGLSGYGSTYFMGGGLYSDSYVENAKSNIANGYELSATSSSYSNKNSVSSSSFAQQCQAIEYLLQQGRTDDAMAKYKELYDDMASNSYYEVYTENEIKTLMQEKYMTATGTTLVNDITTNSNSAFTSGLESSITVLGLLFNENSSDDFVAEATVNEVSGWCNIQKGAGVVAGVGLSAAAGAGLEVGLSALKNLKNSSITEAISKAATGKGKIVAACVAGGAALLTYIGSKLFNSDNK